MLWGVKDTIDATPIIGTTLNPGPSGIVPTFLRSHHVRIRVWLASTCVGTDLMGSEATDANESHILLHDQGNLCYIMYTRTTINHRLFFHRVLAVAYV